MHHGSISAQRLTDLSVLADALPWLRSVASRQASQPWQPILCGPSREAVSVHIARFRAEWNAALRAIASACPSAAGECNVLLKLDPLRPGTDAAIANAVERIRHLSDPSTVRTMRREKERSAFGSTLRRLRVERGLSLRGLAGACKEAAQRLRFTTHTPAHYQLVAFEHGRAGAHRRTRLVIAAALGVPLCELESPRATIS